MLKTFFELRIGDKGPKVKEAVKMLQKAGSAIKDTCVFHIGMVSAVKAFQRRNKLAATGTINQMTWNKLKLCSTKTCKPVKMAGKK